MVKIIKYNNKIDCEHLLGSFLDEKHYDLLIEEDCELVILNNDKKQKVARKIS